MKELDDYDFEGIDRTGLDDPIVEDGLSIQRSVNIASLPIWVEDDDSGPVDPPPSDGSSLALQRLLIEGHRKQAEYHEQMVRKYQGVEPPAQSGKPDPNNDDAITFGL